MGDGRVHLVTAIVLAAHIAFYGGVSALAEVGGQAGSGPPTFAGLMILGAAMLLAGAMVLKRQAVERVIGHPEWFVRLARSFRLTRVLLVLFAFWTFTMAAIGPGREAEASLLPGGERAAAVLSGIVALACTRLMRPRTGWALL
ncbi:MAG: hypothetical protein AAF565_07685 [Pseudomonadota bacterium]